MRQFVNVAYVSMVEMLDAKQRAKVDAMLEADEAGRPATPRRSTGVAGLLQVMGGGAAQ